MNFPDAMRTGRDANPLISVIIPARNEEASLGACLKSLLSQTGEGVPFEIIVVDDGSTDRTNEIARSFDAVRVMASAPLPPGWTGKSNACATGAMAARGLWLLFTDADTFHKPGSLARSVAEAEQYGASLLSYSPEQEIHGMAETLVMPLIFAELARVYKPRLVCHPSSPVAAANGQFLLITREAYDAVGGHAAVARDLLEDVALARRVKQSGRRLRFRYGGELVRTRMYRSFDQLCEGWTKNLALLFPSPEKLAGSRALECLASVGAVAAAASALSAKKYTLAAVSGAIGVCSWINVLRRVRKAHFGTFATAISPLGLPLFSYLLLRSRISHKAGRVSWKGRQYQPNQVLPDEAAPMLEMPVNYD